MSRRCHWQSLEEISLIVRNVMMTMVVVMMMMMVMVMMMVVVVGGMHFS